TAVALDDATKDLRLALRPVEVRRLREPLQRADVLRAARALGDQLLDLRVDLVDLAAKRGELLIDIGRRLIARAHDSTIGITRVESMPSIARIRFNVSALAGASRSTILYELSLREWFSRFAMLMFSPASAVRTCATMFGMLRCGIATRCGRDRGNTASGKFTDRVTLPCSRNSRTLSTTMIAQFSSASRVEAPRCGRQITFGWSIRRRVGKSVTYARSLPASSAPITAVSSTISARAKFSTTAPRGMSCRRLRPTSPSVSGVNGTWTLTTSARPKSSSRLCAFCTADDSCQALCTVIDGS